MTAEQCQRVERVFDAALSVEFRTGEPIRARPEAQQWHTRSREIMENTAVDAIPPGYVFIRPDKLAAALSECEAAIAAMQNRE